MRLGLLAARAVIGGLFIGHGTQKLFGWFGGHGPEGTGGFFESLGLRPGKRHAIAAGAAEAGGGALLALGLLTPAAAALLTAVQVTAIRTVHLEKGPWVTEGGYEYNLVLIAAAFALTDAGPGAWSLDAARGRERWGAGWALAELATGLAGSALATATSEPAQESVTEQAPVAAEGAAATA
jgi:putative oxidoreductase